MKGSKQTIEKTLSEEGKTFDDITLVILTHSHQDHIGGLQELKEVTNAPIMMSSIEYSLIQNSSDDALPTGSIAKKIFRLVSRMERFTKESVMDKPDILVDQHWHLAPFNIDAEVFLTPGHTRGSLSILTAEGDALIGEGYRPCPLLYLIVLISAKAGHQFGEGVVFLRRFHRRPADDQ